MTAEQEQEARDLFTAAALLLLQYTSLTADLRCFISDQITAKIYSTGRISPQTLYSETDSLL
jgi:hypothetical protein